MKSQTKRKVTVNLPEELLEHAMKACGGGTTVTIVQALKLLAAGSAYDQLRKMKGEVKIDLDLRELRRDR